MAPFCSYSAYFRCLNLFSLHHRVTPSQVPSPLVPAYPGATLLRKHAHNGLATARQEGRVPRPLAPGLRGLCASKEPRFRALGINELGGYRQWHQFVAIRPTSAA